METSAGRLISHYRILDKIGAGGMGEVFVAQDTALGRNVALKLIAPADHAGHGAIQRLIREAKAAAQLDHPNICSIYEAGVHEGTGFIAMQLIEGKPLSAIMLERALRPDEILAIATQVADALSEAHRHRIVHRDVKPHNVMVNHRGQAKLVDFGLAKTLERVRLSTTGVTADETMTRPGTISGTIPYMSPEQLRNEGADERSDVWSFGVMLHEMVTGRRPFEADSRAELMSAILRDLPTPPPDSVGEGFGPIIDRCLRKLPAERFQDASQVYSALEILRSTRASKPATREKKSGPRTSRKRSMAMRSLAVLPLDNHSADPDQEYFAEAMTETLLTVLAQISGIRVVSRTSVMGYKRTQKPLPEIARELDVDVIVEGSVLRVGDRVRITAQLIHGATDRHLWAKSYERDVQDILSLQNEVARSIAEEISIQLTPRERSRLLSARRVNREAHEAYLKGIYHFDRLDMGRGMEYFLKSTQIDATYAPAWGRLARGYYYLGLFGAMAPIDAFSKLKDAAWKAQDLDPELAEAYGWRAMANLYYDWDWTAAGEELRRAIELNPNHAEISHYYAHYLMVVGLTEKGLKACERAVELDPMGTILSACIGWHCLFSRQIDDAVPAALRALSMDPNLFWGHLVLGWAYEHQGKADEAIAAYEKAIQFSGAMVLTVAALAHAHARFGKPEEARKALAELIERRKTSYVSAYDIATVYIGLGEIDSAFLWLDEAFVERASFLIHLNWDPRVDAIRSDSRFEKLVRRIGFPSAGRFA